MGHSTVTTYKKGMLSSSEIEKAVEDASYDDQDFAQVRGVDKTVRHIIYSESAADEVTENLGRYESVAVYYVPDQIWDKHFKVDKSVTKLEQKLADKRKMLTQVVTDFKAKIDKNKVVLISCEKCQSKLNASVMRDAPNHCPVCGQKDEKLATLWKTKMVGKSVTKKIDKLKSEIETIQNAIKLIYSKRVSQVSIHELPKSMSKEVYTLIAADIHH